MISLNATSYTVQSSWILPPRILASFPTGACFLIVFMTNCCTVPYVFQSMSYSPQRELHSGSVCDMGMWWVYLVGLLNRRFLQKEINRREGKHSSNSVLGLLFCKQCHIVVTYIWETLGSYHLFRWTGRRPHLRVGHFCIGFEFWIPKNFITSQRLVKS